MNPLNDTYRAIPREPIYLSDTLLNKARFNGHSVVLVEDLSEESYFLYFAKSQGHKTNADDRGQMKSDLKSSLARFINRRKFTIELKNITTCTLVGFISCKIEGRDDKKVLDIKYLSISRDNQRKGFGSYLIKCAIDIAENHCIPKVTLVDDFGTEEFYTKKIGMHNLGPLGGLRDNMELNISSFKHSLDSNISHLDLYLSDRQKRTQLKHLSVV
ncbi:GNAT family N-acetyltransferase [Endozoicomonas numazuensis]|uniref:N-acetyltransferase domain-containing protein n=1 Tax=Endozoicomonas numazuensis TaxID=1137799 RepID=A0A081NDY7_9GAMM|nr:GNAT family N-acetyltransferase [Endozoicomonas numazuensis]KEQ16660.1 hypothetical protein GZ78_18245 [Endozoicomonas numazuensis]